MTDKSNVIEQTKAAFDFIERLYVETSYLIKQLEGVLAKEPEAFNIGRPGGYGVTTSRSAGLDSDNVRLWLMTKFSVFFIPKAATHLERGQSVTKLEPNLRVLYFRFLLHGKDIVEPTAYGGVLFNIAKKSAAKWITKFEHIMGYIEYNDGKVFRSLEEIDYQDSYINLRGRLVSTNLFDINDSEAITDKLIRPGLSLYRNRT